jgi:hypothetical protein
LEAADDKKGCIATDLKQKQTRILANPNTLFYTARSSKNI